MVVPGTQLPVQVYYTTTKRIRHFNLQETMGNICDSESAVEGNEYDCTNSETHSYSGEDSDYSGESEGSSAEQTELIMPISVFP